MAIVGCPMIANLPELMLKKKLRDVESAILLGIHAGKRTCQQTWLAAKSTVYRWFPSYKPLYLVRWLSHEKPSMKCSMISHRTNITKNPRFSARSISVYKVIFQARSDRPRGDQFPSFASGETVGKAMSCLPNHLVFSGFHPSSRFQMVRILWIYDQKRQVDTKW